MGLKAGDIHFPMADERLVQGWGLQGWGQSLSNKGWRKAGDSHYPMADPERLGTVTNSWRTTKGWGPKGWGDKGCKGWGQSPSGERLGERPGTVTFQWKGGEQSLAGQRQRSLGPKPRSLGE